MGLKDLLLKKGRGVGELKDLRKEHWLNAEVIRVLKELDLVDKKADQALTSRDYGRYFACIKGQMSLIGKIDHYAQVRLVRAEYAYKDVEKFLDQAEEDYRNKSKRLQEEEKRLYRQNPGDVDVNTIKAGIAKARTELHHFKTRVDDMKREIELLRGHLRQQCRLKMGKIKKIYRFA